MIFKSFLSMIQKHKMLDKTKTVVVGFSGGADSVTLTHLLSLILKERNIELIAVHVNHGLRGLEAQRDEDFVKQFCNDLKIELVVERANVLDFAEQSKIGVEEAGRKIRYDAFEKVASQRSFSRIATAHTLSDNAETLLMHLISGTGLKGLCGIPPVRDNIIRPLLGIQRQEIETYCKINNLNYMTDSSNLEKNYTRNKIRLELLPLIKSINPNFEEAISRTVKTINRDENFLENESERALKSVTEKSSWNASLICELEESLKNRVIFKILKSLTNSRVEQKHVNQVEELIENKKGYVSIPGGVTLSVQNGYLVSVSNEPIKELQWEYAIKPLNVLTEIKTTIIIKVISFVEYKNMTPSEKSHVIGVVSSKKLNAECVFRNRRPGDRFKFPSRKISKSVKKIFNEMKIPLNQRYQIPILACGEKILWIEGIGTSADYLPNSDDTELAIIVKE